MKNVTAYLIEKCKDISICLTVNINTHTYSIAHFGFGIRFGNNKNCDIVLVSTTKTMVS